MLFTAHKPGRRVPDHAHPPRPSPAAFGIRKVLLHAFRARLYLRADRADVEINLPILAMLFLAGPQRGACCTDFWRIQVHPPGYPAGTLAFCEAQPPRAAGGLVERCHADGECQKTNGEEQCNSCLHSR
jgi:hypothetical protein